MKAGGLIDTGAILALLDRDDAWHTACVETFGGLRLPLLTSEAVLAELFHLVGEKRHEVNAAWEFLRCGAVLVAELNDQELPAIRALMAKYHDLRMDFADATLVYLAARESLNTIFTVDRTDFETYRIANRRRFRVLPERAAR